MICLVNSVNDFYLLNVESRFGVNFLEGLLDYRCLERQNCPDVFFELAQGLYFFLLENESSDGIHDPPNHGLPLKKGY